MSLRVERSRAMQSVNTEKEKLFVFVVLINWLLRASQLLFIVIASGTQ